MHVDVDEDLVVAITEGESTPLVVAPLQRPSGMVLRAHMRQEVTAAPAPAPLAVTSDHVDLAAASPSAPPDPARGAWERLASRRLPRICELWVGASCTWHCISVFWRVPRSCQPAACGGLRVLFVPSLLRCRNVRNDAAPLPPVPRRRRRDRLACAAVGSNLAAGVCCLAALCGGSAGG